MIDENTVDTRTERVKQKYIYIYRYNTSPNKKC